MNDATLYFLTARLRICMNWSENTVSVAICERIPTQHFSACMHALSCYLSSFYKKTPNEAAVVHPGSCCQPLVCGAAAELMLRRGEETLPEKAHRSRQNAVCSLSFPSTRLGWTGARFIPCPLTPARTFERQPMCRRSASL